MEFLQSILALSNPVTHNSTANTSVAGSSNTSWSSAYLASGDISQVALNLIASAVVPDWAKLFIFGAIIELCRRLFYSFWSLFLDVPWITVTFDNEDKTYSWMLYWLSRHSSWQRPRTAEVTTRNFGVTLIFHWPHRIYSEKEDPDQPITYIPGINKVHSMWYKYHYIRVSRKRASEMTLGHQRETLELSILAFSHAIVNAILDEAKEMYNAAKADIVSVYTANTHYEWAHVTSQPKRPLKTIIFDPGVKQDLTNDAKEFLRSRKWYADRGIPFRRGYLLYGPPGSGKTSVIRAIAGELGLDVYVVTLSRPTLDDNTLYKLIADFPERCIALMEDIDVAFRHDLSQRLPFETSIDPDSDDPTTVDAHTLTTASTTTTSSLSLSGLLNALDGVAAQKGRLLFATTNDYGALDPALCRPGRMDVHVEFHNASKFQAEELFRVFYSPSHSDSIGESETEITSTSTHDAKSYGELRAEQTTPLLGEEPSSTGKVQIAGSPTGVMLPRNIASQLAKQFCQAIPDRELSVAALQGPTRCDHLMRCMMHPVGSQRYAGRRGGKLSLRVRLSDLRLMSPRVGEPFVPVDALSEDHADG